ncbi:MAG: hypothetical protein K2M76_07270 [Muribaculaceae bacterium]|nr:hypothetical protein [Muribaculaceae bacterium]
MKLRSYIAISVAALASAACSDGGYWEESLPQGEVYAFPKTSVSLELEATDQIPTSYDIEVLRNNAGQAATVAVNPKFDGAVLSGADSVTFEAGKNVAIYTVTIDASKGWQIGAAYKVSLTLDNDKYTVAEKNNAAFTFSIKQDYTWLAAGQAKVQSGWVDGLAGKYDVEVERAKEYNTDGNKLYRMVSPYYVMEPDYAEEGAHLQFVLTSANDPVWITPAFQYIGESDDSYGNFYFTLQQAYGSTFTRDGSVYTLEGLISYDGGTGGASQSLYGYETIKFDYTAPTE